jgi:hypothetical protein
MCARLDKGSLIWRQRCVGKGEGGRWRGCIAFMCARQVDLMLMDFDDDDCGSIVDIKNFRLIVNIAKVRSTGTKWGCTVRDKEIYS